MGFVASMTALPARLAAPAARSALRCHGALDSENHHFAKLGRVGEAAHGSLGILLRPVRQLGRHARAHQHVMTVFQETTGEHFRHIAGPKNPDFHVALPL